MPVERRDTDSGLPGDGGHRGVDPALREDRSGGVGNAAVQLGRAYGAEVTGLARAANLDFVRGLGAHEALDHRSVRPEDLGRFDVVLDTAGTDLRTFRGLLNPGGRMVTIAFDLENVVSSLGYIAASTVHGRGRVRFFSGNPNRALLDDLGRHVTAKELSPAVDTVFPLEETAAAHRALEAGGVQGKYVVSVVDAGQGPDAGSGDQPRSR